MELREFLQIFVREWKLLLVILGTALLIGFFSYRLQHQWYRGEVLLSVARTAVEASPDYHYDQFYRLRADERMADTVARYLESKTGQRETAQRALLREDDERIFMRCTIEATRISSQLIRVTFSARTMPEAERIARAMTETSNRYVESLNEQAGDRNWFTVIESEPVIQDGRFSLPLALLVGFLSGVFIAFWTALGLHYFRAHKNPQRGLL